MALNVSCRGGKFFALTLFDADFTDCTVGIRQKQVVGVWHSVKTIRQDNRTNKIFYQ